MMDKYIQENSASEFTTVCTREHRHQSESPFTEASGTCTCPPIAPLTTVGYSSDMGTGATRNSHQRPPTPQQADIDTDDRTVFPSRNTRAKFLQTSNMVEQYKNIIDAITMPPTRIQAMNKNHKLLHT